RVKLSNPFCGWLKDEADIRVAETREYGALKNIVYTPEGGRRSAMLSVKYAIFSLCSPSSSSSSLSLPEVDVPYYLDQWMDQFGMYRIVDSTGFGDANAFEEWKQNQLIYSLSSGRS